MGGDDCGVRQVKARVIFFQRLERWDTRHVLSLPTRCPRRSEAIRRALVAYKRRGRSPTIDQPPQDFLRGKAGPSALDKCAKLTHGKH